MPTTGAGSQITPAMEARFRAIADAQPPLQDAEIRSRLQQNPAIDPKVYYAWRVRDLGDKANQQLSGSPVSATMISQILKQAQYNDPKSLGVLVKNLQPVTLVEPVPIGTYTSASGTKSLCFLQPQPAYMPEDFEATPTRGDAVVTQAKCDPVSSTIPEFFTEIGQLHLVPGATTALDEKSATEFYLGVTPNRAVFAFWNPLGANPEYIRPDPAARSDLPDLRPTAGTFPGFTTPCTAVQLNLSIDDLLRSDQATRPLPITQENLLNLPNNGKITFGGVDTDGWERLNRVSPQFAAVPTYSGSAAAAAAP